MSKPYYFAFLWLVVGHSVGMGAQVYNNGQPNQLDGANISSYFAADDFTISRMSVVTQITFGSSADADPYPQFSDPLNWSILREVNGVPGAVVAEGSAVPSFTDTGTQILGTEDFLITIPVSSNGALSLVPGSYWLALSINPSLEWSQSIYWDSTSAVHGSPAMTRASVDDGWTPALSGVGGSDLAFALSGTVDDQIVTPEASSFAFSVIGIVAIAICSLLSRGSRKSVC